MVSITEENYLKAILNIARSNRQAEVGVKQLADALNVKAATVSDMLKKLKKKGFVDYEKYGKISITQIGNEKAVLVLRKHRLWETFLCDKLNFDWDKVHEIAEQLEHIQSPELIEKLDHFLGYPIVDPHGELIPNIEGIFPEFDRKTMQEIEPKRSCRVVGVKDSSSDFLQHIEKLGLQMNTSLLVLEKAEYDGMMLLEIEGKQVGISKEVSEKVLVA